jgi:hypothetical protein
MKQINIIRNIAITAALGLMSLGISAQTTLCDFSDATTYDSLKVYDSSPLSPFYNEANPSLTPNFSVVEYPYGSGNINALGLQRSRYGSNRFGAKIRLHTPFSLTTSTQYVHVFIYCPRSARPMLIGLGKRSSNSSESDQVQQFWTLASNASSSSKWYDAVFPIFGHADVSISSLVVVPDAESSHNLTSDIAVYMANIILSSSSTARTVSGVASGDYPLNFDESATSSRSDRYLTSISLQGSKTTTKQTLSTGNKSGSSNIYVDLTSSPFLAMVGETLTPTFDYTGGWMHGYVYLDEGKDGAFSYTINSDYTPNSDLKTYSGYSTNEATSSLYYNSTGTNIKNANPGCNPPSFILNSSLASGFYRMRYKVDWCYLDPGGNITNSIISNCGAVVDVRLNVHSATVPITVQTRNGEVLSTSGTELSGTSTEFGKTLTVVLKPAPGFKQNGITLRHGYNLTGSSKVHSTTQWEEIAVPASSFTDNQYTIPAAYIDGDLQITAEFAEKDKVKLSEDEAYSPIANGGTAQSANVILGRTFKAGWNTLCLPFSLTDSQISSVFGSDASVATLAGVSGNTLKFSTDTRAITAHQPCLLKISEAGSSYTINDATVEPLGTNGVTQTFTESDGSSLAFTGVYVPITATTVGTGLYACAKSPSETYFISGGKFYNADFQSSVSMKGFRAYMVYTPSTSAAKVKAFDVAVDGQATAIEGTLEGVLSGNKAVYNLTGQMVDRTGTGLKKMAKGVYVVGGKKIVVK